MKALLIGIAFIAVIGTAGFWYRYQEENSETAAANAAAMMAVASTTAGTACTADAKICPDGSAVGRTGSNCTFAQCASPNVELDTGSTTIAFVLPAGYQRNIVTTDDSTYLASYIQSTDASSDASSSVIDIHVLPIPAGQTAGQVMLANTIFSPSELAATSTGSFENVSKGNNVFSEVLIGNFEGTVQSAYYLVQANSVIRFDITELSVQNWTDPNLNVNALPQHQALEQMLATLQVGQTQ